MRPRRRHAEVRAAIEPGAGGIQKCTGTQLAPELLGRTLNSQDARRLGIRGWREASCMVARCWTGSFQYDTAGMPWWDLEHYYVLVDSEVCTVNAL